MSDLIFSQTGFWTAFTMIFMLGVMAWFIYKMMKLSKPKSDTKD